MIMQLLQFFIVLFMSMMLMGCHALGWEPGPATGQVSEIPIPGGGPDGQAIILKLSGERDTRLVLSGMQGDGVHWPSISNMTLDRVASTPLQARGQQQFAIEGQRMEYAISALERSVASLQGAIAGMLPLMAQYTPQLLNPTQSAASTQPSAKDRMLELLLLKFEDELTKP